MKVNTELCVDLKTKLRNEVLMVPGKMYHGIIRRDECCEEFGSVDPHYTFIETAPSTAGKRNPHVLVGEYITVTLKDDGTPRLNFKPLKIGKGFDKERYALSVAFEIIQALKQAL